MADIGLFHTLTVSDVQNQGLYLNDGEGGRILLPKRYVPDNTNVGDEIKVFVYLDSDDRPIATTQRPRVTLHQAANLQVVDVNTTGAFLDWGLPKDLFVPFAEQNQRMEPGNNYVVYVTLDNTGRLIGSNKLNRFIQDEAKAIWPGEPAPFEQGDKVKMLIAQRTDIGYKAIVNDKYWGVLHESQIHTAIRVGQRFEGYVRRVREEDHRLDLSLEPLGHTRADPVAKKILAKLHESGGSLGLGDHSPADLIELHFGVSKRAFKMAMGKLFKQREIVIIPEGICLPDHPAAASGTSERKAHRSSTIPRSQKTEKKTPAAKTDQKTPRDTDTMTTDSPKADATDTDTATVQPWGNHTKKASHSDANNRSPENDSKRSTKHSKPANTQDKSTKSKKTVYRNPKNKTASTLSLKK
jgi:predicted RNA-binding protein (virulence factor B family)